MVGERTVWETIKVQGNELVDRVKRIIEKGNVRRIVIRQRGETVMEFPLAVGVVAAAILPVLTAVGAVAALLSDCTIDVERVVPTRREKRVPENGGRRKEN